MSDHTIVIIWVMKIFFVQYFWVFLSPLKHPGLGASGQKTNREGAQPISRQLDQSFTEHGPAHPEQDPVFPTASPSHQEGFSSVQFSSVTQSCPTLCDPMNCSTPGLPVYHHLPEFTQTHGHPAISSSVVTFASCPQSLPASESFPMSQLFT